MKYQCNSCGVVYENRSSAVNCHPDINEIPDEELESRLAAQQSVQPTIATAALEDSPFETGMRRNAVVLSNRNSG